jgi:hypothetical protein
MRCGGGACSRHVTDENEHRILAVTPEGRRLVERPRHR